MKYKTRIELTLPNKIEPFTEAAKLRKIEGVLEANVRDVNSLVLFYDRRQITEKKLLKTITGISAASA